MLVMLLALAWRLVAVEVTAVLESDGAHYATLARRALEGDWTAGLDPAWPPMFPWLTALTARWIGGATTDAIERAAFLVSALAGTLVLIPMWEVARSWLGIRLANVAIVLIAFHPQAVSFSSNTATDGVFAAFFAFAFLAFERGRTASIARRAGIGFVLAGLIAATAVLVRPEGWVLLIGFAFFLLRGKTAVSRIRSLSLLLAPGLVILIPWLFYLHGETGVWGPGSKGDYNFYVAHYDTYEAHGIAVTHGHVDSIRAPGEEWESGDYRVAEVVRAAPGEIAARMASIPLRSVIDKLPAVVSWPIFLLALLAFCRPKGERPPWIRLVIVLLATTIAFYTPFFVMRRFFLPFLPFAVMAATAELARFAAWRSPDRPNRVLIGVTVLGLVLMLADSTRSFVSEEAHTELRTAGRWMREHVADNGESNAPVLAGRNPVPAYFARISYRQLRFLEQHEVREWMAAEDATHLMLDDKRTPTYNSQLAPWLTPGGEPDWLEERVDFRENGNHAVLFRVRPTGARGSSMGDLSR